MYSQINKLLQVGTDTIYAVLLFNYSIQQRFIDELFMPGYVEAQGVRSWTSLDLVPAHMKVISLMSKTGKRNYESMHTCIIQIWMYVIIGNRAEKENEMGELI